MSRSATRDSGHATPRKHSPRSGESAAGRPEQLTAGEAAGHPALVHWRQLRPSGPGRALTVLKGGRLPRKSGAYLLEGTGGDGAVVAKRCPRDVAALERLAYVLLARLPVTALRCWGVVEDPDPGYAWLFVDAAPGAPFDPTRAAERRLLARWLAPLHALAAERGVRQGLPARDLAHFLGHLRGARERIGAHFESPALGEAHRELLDALLRQLDVVESHWRQLEEACADVPATLVHGDIAPRNVRVGEEGVWVFDWEMAGWGLAGADLLRVDLDVYADALGGALRMDVAEQARVGRLLRGCLAPIGWETLSLGHAWVETPLRNLASYRGRLERWLAQSGWEATRSRRPRPARTVAQAASHPAARAWRRVSPGGRCPTTVLALRRKPASQVFRLVAAAPDGRDVVAKRCPPESGAHERRLYDEVLPRVGIRGLRCHGTTCEADGTWLFLEDAGDLPASPEEPRVRTLLTCLLASLHVGAARHAHALGLPARDARHHARRLRAARDSLASHPDNPALSPADRWVLRGLASLCAELEARWSEVEAVCAEAPSTLVHGDLSAANLRLVEEGGEVRLAVLDWETAGIGPPAPDLTSVDPELYAALVSPHWSGISPAQVRRWCWAGEVLRGVTAIDWEGEDLGFPWVEKPMSRLRVYRQRLEALLRPGREGARAVGGRA